MKIYIAGKISGLVYEDALRAFAEAEQLLRTLGHEPVNPMKECPLEDGVTWTEYMRRDIPHLLACDGIYLLPNWHESKGASLEHHIAAQLGMHIHKCNYVSIVNEKDEITAARLHKEAFDAIDALLTDKPAAECKQELRELIAVAEQKLEGIERLEQRNGLSAA